MRNIAVLVSLLFSFTSAKSTTMSDQVTTTIQQLFRATDQKDWNAVTATFGPEVRLDYSSMTQAPAETLTPDLIVSAWKQVLPGFVSTHHQIGDIEVSQQEDHFLASTRGLAAHYLPDTKGDLWVVYGSYDFKVAPDATGQLGITAMTFHFEGQSGNTALPAAAMERVHQGTAISLQSPKASEVATIEEFFTALEAMNIDRFMQVWAENPTQNMPLSPKGFPKKLEGKQAILRQYSSLPENFQSMAFPRSITPTAEAGKYVVQYRGIIELGEGKMYNNQYAAVVELENDRIKTFTEYFDPVVLVQSFGLDLQENFNVPSETGNFQSVDFLSEGLVLKGNLYLPKDYQPTQQYPAIVIAGSWTSIKEQMAGLYAQKLAEQGFLTLAFDFRTWGESEGQPRQYENPEMKIEDLVNAAEFLGQRSDISTISAMGICAGAGYASYAATKTSRFQDVILVAPWLHNAELVDMIYDGKNGHVDHLIDLSQKATKAFTQTGETPYVPAASTTDSTAAMYLPDGGFDYYVNPEKGAIPAYDNRFAVMSWEKWLTFDGIAAAQQLDKPVYIVHSENGAVPAGTKQFYEDLSGSKELVWLDQYNQLQFYYEADAVQAAVTQIVNWKN